MMAEIPAEMIDRCPACRRGDHFNHEPRTQVPSRYPDVIPEFGACWTVANGRLLCACPYKVVPTQRLTLA